MKRNIYKTSRRALLISLVALPLILWGMSSSAQKPGSKVAANLDQIRNGAASAPIDPPTWVNGNAGKTNAHYREGESIAYRMVITGLKANTEHDLQIEWDITHSGVNAIDYITHYDRSSPTVQPCIGINPCVLADTSGAIYNIPAPTGINSPVAGMPEDSFAALPIAQKKMSVYNGTLSGSGMTYVSQGDLSQSQSATRMNIHFTAGGSTVVIAWGGHIGSRLDWGFFPDGVTPRSAGGISGSPYHTRLISIDGGGGNQDRSLSADAVLPPLNCLVQGDREVCAGAVVTYTSSIDADSYSWSISGNGTIRGTAGTTDGLTTAKSIDVLAGASGSYSLTLTVMKDGTSGGSCPFTANIHKAPVVSSISLSNECDPQLVTLTANLDPDSIEAGAMYAYLWNTGETTASITPTAPGTYSVTVTNLSAPTGSSCSTGGKSVNLCFAIQP